jgi:hypothetical protein
VILLSSEEEDDDMSGASEIPGLVVQTPPNSGWLLPPLSPNEETNASLKEEVSPVLGDNLYHLRSNNTTLAKWFQ